MELRPNQFRAACRGCHGGCVHILTVENGKLVKVEPDPDAPLNKGRACAKGVSIIEQMYHPDRVIYPMRRIGPRGSGQWERIPWEEALSAIAAKLTDIRDTCGPESISLFTGTGRHHMARFWRFSHVLGTPNGVSSGPLICLDPRAHGGPPSGPAQRRDEGQVPERRTAPHHQGHHGTSPCGAGGHAGRLPLPHPRGAVPRQQRPFVHAPEPLCA